MLHPWLQMNWPCLPVAGRNSVLLKTVTTHEGALWDIDVWLHELSTSAATTVRPFMAASPSPVHCAVHQYDAGDMSSSMEAAGRLIHAALSCSPDAQAPVFCPSRPLSSATSSNRWRARATVEETTNEWGHDHDLPGY
ncbi:hypothetical protein PVAP13_2NG351300 [Panicum virgatum]|uniref:Uncharacterized protein n=1 Tax=Panicum virgatum TaxID=38727 RepID=A0A8T0VLT2_PANVG|nr:hypothetical protein PVAP13_2NG351300 [Panicum virgatum]